MKTPYFYLLIFVTVIFSQVNPEIGLRDRTPHVYAFINARIVVSPGNEIQQGTIVVRDQKIVEIGKNVDIPKDARILDMTGKTIYPGFIDMYVETPMAESAGKSAHPHWNSRVHPETTPTLANLKDEDADALRKAGFTTALLVPEKGIFRGNGQLVNLGDEKNNALAGSVSSQWIAFEHGSWADETYPNSLLGTIALIRQSFFDANWYGEALNAWINYPAENPKPQTDDALQALATHLSGNSPFVFKVDDDINALRALKLSTQFNLPLWMAGSGYEYRRIDEIAQSSPFIILPLNFPAAPDVTAEEYAIDVSLRDLRHWDMAPDNPRILDEHEISFALTSAKLKDRSRFKKNVLHSVYRGLDKDKALSSLTVIPAKQLGVQHILGTLESGKYANLLVTDGDYFDEGTKVLSVWVEGHEFVQDGTGNKVSVQGAWSGALAESQWTYKFSLSEKKGTYSGAVNHDTTKVSLDKLKYEPPFVFFSFQGEELPGLDKGIYRYSGTNIDGNITGTLIAPDGTPSRMTLVSEVSDEEQKEPAKSDFPPKSNLKTRYPEGAFGLDSPPEKYDDIIIENATIWTSGDSGILENGSIWIKNGKFYKVGQNINAPRSAEIIDARGKTITPGLIDCHSHTALHAVNEGTQSITSEVRIKDVINPNDIAIYRELAGGLTMANLFHGSANAIGGQNAVVKLKWGQTADEMIYQNAPEGIKFALGENVKQSNWGDNYTTRYPQTRMGVDQIIRDGFSAAREYQQKWEEYTALSKREQKKIAPPRTDLELEALSEVLKGQRLVHCHSYRQDEILNLMRIAEDFDFRIRTFQHILEGYKVADAMRKHGAGGSTFSDWWAYKFEVYDAIPYNAALMHEQGVLVSMNSDSNELARRMNLEAAKAVKYGNVSREDALKMVTLYPAQQLKIDQWVGSIEPGKDADFVIWSGDPLSVYTKCEQTWIDGMNYFDLDKDLEMRRRDAEERQTLIQKVLITPDKNGEKGHEWRAPNYLEHSCGTEIGQ